MPTLLNLKNRKFGRLIVLRRLRNSRDNRVVWKCLCDCGKTVSVRSHALTTNNTNSCGCFRRDQVSKAKTTHGHTRYGHWTTEYRLWSAAKFRAIKQKVKFAINLSHVTIPEVCPLLGIKIKIGVKKWTANSPSIDRINPSLGYVPGNVWVISHHANTIKNDASLKELQLIVSGLEKRL
jgi:hypothetical protein